MRERLWKNKLLYRDVYYSIFRNADDVGRYQSDELEISLEDRILAQIGFKRGMVDSARFESACGYTTIHRQMELYQKDFQDSIFGDLVVNERFDLILRVFGFHYYPDMITKDYYDSLSSPFPIKRPILWDSPSSASR